MPWRRPRRWRRGIGPAPTIPTTNSEHVPQQLVALALWRITSDQEVMITDAMLDSDEFGYLRTPDKLLADPLPAEFGTPPQLNGRFDPVLRCADWIMGHNHVQYPGSTRSPRILGTSHRCPRPTTRATVPPRPRSHSISADGCSAVPNSARRRPRTQRSEVTRRHRCDDVFKRSWLARLQRLARIGDAARDLEPGVGDLGEL